MSLASYMMTTSSAEDPRFKDLYLFHGKSAYQAAVERGYKGTEDEWLASLRDIRFGTKATFTDTDVNLIYVDLETNNIYRYDGTNKKYQPIGGVLGETADTAYRGDRGKIAYDHSQSDHDFLHRKGGTMLGDITTKNLLPVSDITHSLGSATAAYASIYGSNIRAQRGGYQYGSIQVDAIGSASAVGIGALILGNAIGEGTAGNASGRMYIYGEGKGAIVIVPNYSADTNIHLNLPSYAGTLARVEDNVASATVLQTARTIAISGKATGTATSFDGSDNISIPITAIDPTGITQSASYRLVSDSQINAWNEKPTQAEMKAAIAALVDSSPSTLDTLNEIAAALGDDPNFATTMTTELGKKLNLAGGTMTGDIKSQNIVPSANNTYELGSAAYVYKNIYATKFTGNLTGNADTATALTSSAGGAGNPVYFSGGKPVACSFNLNADLLKYSGSLASAGWKTLGGRSSGNKITVSYNNAAADWNSGTYSSTIVFGCADTKGLLDCGHNKPIVTFGGGSVSGSTDDAPTWYFKLVGTSAQSYTLPSTGGTLAKTTDNVASASKLNSSVTLTIGDKGKAFDGSSNVSWTLTEIGAFASAGGTITGAVTMNSTLTVKGTITLAAVNCGAISSTGLISTSAGGKFASIELTGTTPFIDFHYGGSTADYTTRLYESSSGALTCTGTFSATKVYNAVWNDYAEYFERGCETEPGDIIALDLDSDEERYVKAVDGDIVCGIHSDSYGHIVGGDVLPDDFHGTVEEFNENKYIPVGMVGRVMCKVVGPVKKGDSIYASDIPGVGIAKCATCVSAPSFVGYACEANSSEDIKKVKVLLKK